MAQLALEAAMAHLLARVLVERRGMQSLGHAVDDRGAELHALGAQQTAGGLDQPVDGGPLAVSGRAQGAAVAAARQELGLGVAQGIAGGQQVQHRRALRTDKLVDSPCGDGRLAQRRHLTRLLTAPLLAQPLCERGALGDEAIERQAVEVVGVHGVMVPGARRGCE